MRIVFSVIILSVAFLTASCDQGDFSYEGDQIERGQAIYEQSCATSTCHGVQGEGILENNRFRVWPLVGVEFQHRNPTAQVIFDVVRSGGETSLRGLTDQQIYDAIAYELSLNGVSIPELLTSKNAPITNSGNLVKIPKSGSLYPPPGNTELSSNWPAAPLPICGENVDLRICVTQMALADSIGGMTPSNGGRFILIVSTIEVLADHPFEVKPQYLRLENKDRQQLKPLDINLDYPVTRFRNQMIQPEYGTAVLSIFAQSKSTEIGRLLYNFPEEQPLSIKLIP